ncbi:MAG: TraV family lipoprotein [Gallionella sp.]|nr:TraV family lipoprotein [Gallionella sp.]
MMRTLLPLVCLLMAGCAGLDSESHFKCKAPEGIGCSSLSGTYANAIEDNLPGSPVTKTATYESGEEKERAISGVAPSTGTPILSEPVVLRIWVAPWEDGRKVLHDQAYLYAVADPGHWQIEHNRKHISDKYRVLTPFVRKESAPQEPKLRPQSFQPNGADSQSQNSVN